MKLLDELEAKARAAPNGPWSCFDDPKSTLISRDSSETEAQVIAYGLTPEIKDFICKFDKDTVLKLLDVVRAAKTLAANAGGLRIEEQGIRALVGNTNWWCVEHSCEEVTKALAALEQDDE